MNLTFALPFAYVSIIPFLYLGVLALAFAMALFMKMWKQDWSYLKRLGISWVVLTGLFVFFFMGPFVGYTKHGCSPATWSLQKHKGEQWVKLVYAQPRKFKPFKDVKGFYVLSPKLQQSLKKSGKKQVNTCMAFSYDYGTLRAWDFMKTKVDGIFVKRTLSFREVAQDVAQKKEAKPLRNPSPKSRK